MSVFIPVILGTGRDGRQSEKVATYVRNKLQNDHGDVVETALVDPREHLVSPFTTPGWVEDENAQKWREIAQEAAGYIAVSPEYNHSFPGELKLLLDSADEDLYEGKPVGLVGVSRGVYGGVRMLEHLIAYTSRLRMMPVPHTTATAKVETLFADDDPADEKYAQFLEKTLDAVTRYAQQRS